MVSKFGITDKVIAVVTDNGTKVVKEFSLHAFEEEAADEEDGADIEPEVGEADEEVDDSISNREREHIRCACRTIQLVVKDGLKKCPTGALKKANTIIRHSHHSGTATEILEANKATRLQMSNATRWSSQLTAIESLMRNSLELINELCPHQKLTE